MSPSMPGSSRELGHCRVVDVHKADIDGPPLVRPPDTDLARQSGVPLRQLKGALTVRDPPASLCGGLQQRRGHAALVFTSDRERRGRAPHPANDQTQACDVARALLRGGDDPPRQRDRGPERPPRRSMICSSHATRHRLAPTPRPRSERARSMASGCAGLSRAGSSSQACQPGARRAITDVRPELPGREL